jgi:hypothetical protein
LKTEIKDLRDFSMGNIEETLNYNFSDFLIMPRKMRNQMVNCIATIASNAYRIGYYAHSIDKNAGALTTDDFDFNKQEFLNHLTWLIQEYGK